MLQGIMCAAAGMYIRNYLISVQNCHFKKWSKYIIEILRTSFHSFILKLHNKSIYFANMVNLKKCASNILLLTKMFLAIMSAGELLQPNV